MQGPGEVGSDPAPALHWARRPYPPGSFTSAAESGRGLHTSPADPGPEAPRTHLILPASFLSGQETEAR